MGELGKFWREGALRVETKVEKSGDLSFLIEV